MRAVVLDEHGDASVLRVRDDVAVPQPQGEDVRVRVRAIGINRAEILHRRGSYPAPPDAYDARIPGLEYVGEIDALGPRARERSVGQRVFGIVGSGSYAQYLCVHERTTMHVPSRLSDIDAAAVPEAFMTAYDALVQARFSLGSSVLVHAVGSGVGVAATQLIAMGAGISLGTSRSPDKLAQATKLGLTRGVAFEDAYDDVARAMTAGLGVDAVLDFIGAPALARNLSALRVGGTLVQIGTLGGRAGNADLGIIMAKRATLVGTTLRARPLEEKIALARAFERAIVPLFARGLLRPVVDRTFAFDDIARAHEHMEADANFGKIVVVLA